MSFIIKDVDAYQVFDSRGIPTIEVVVSLSGGAKGTFIVPSGKSTGMYEALELRDGGPELGGKTVHKAISNILNEIAPVIIGMDARNQAALDKVIIDLDGTPNKTRLGANAILGCSAAVCWAAAAQKGVPLYRHIQDIAISRGGSGKIGMPAVMAQMFGGGAHAEDSVDVQCYSVRPIGFESAEAAYIACLEVWLKEQEIYQELGRPLSFADEGGLWPTDFENNEEGLKLMVEAMKRAGFVPWENMGITLDIASSEFYDEETGIYKLRYDKKELTSDEMVDYLADWVEKYPIVSIEDGCAENDWAGQIALTKRLGDKIQLIGDDAFTTNIGRLAQGVEMGALNAILIKMNQIGSMTETIDTIIFAQKHGYNPVVSGRSGDSEDVTQVHLAVGTDSYQSKIGGVCRSERVVKWNEMIRIEHSEDWKNR